MSRLLTLNDIADQRAYEREREQFRSRIIALKKRRRVPVGPVVTFVFESRDTIRFQIQEMARVEKLLTDDAIKIELDTYNPLIPAPGELSATMFIEMVTEEEQLRWKPLLIGILETVSLRIGTGSDVVVVNAEIEESHAAMLTREIPPSVNYIRFQLGTGQILDDFREGPVALVIDHPEYCEATTLSDSTAAELLSDLHP